VVAARTRTLGRTHVDTLTSRMGLALAYLAAGAVPEARAQLESALSVAEEAHGRAHPHVIELRVALARAHVADGQMLAAVAELDVAIAASATAYGPDHQETTDLHAERDELQPAAT
jgi:hypothetical protein